MNSLLSLIVVGLALATLFFFVNKNNQATNKKIEMLEDYRQEKFKKLENINDSDFLAPDSKNEFEVKASEEVVSEISTTQEVVEQAVDNGSKASVEIPNSASANQPSVKEKYASAFGLDGFELINK